MSNALRELVLVVVCSIFSTSLARPVLCPRVGDLSGLRPLDGKYTNITVLSVTTLPCKNSPPFRAVSGLLVGTGFTGHLPRFELSSIEPLTARRMTLGAVHHPLSFVKPAPAVRPHGPHGLLRNRGARGIGSLALLKQRWLVAEVFHPEGKLLDSLRSLLSVSLCRRPCIISIAWLLEDGLRQ